MLENMNSSTWPRKMFYDVPFPLNVFYEHHGVARLFYVVGRSNVLWSLGCKKRIFTLIHFYNWLDVFL